MWQTKNNAKKILPVLCGAAMLLTAATCYAGSTSYAFVAIKSKDGTEDVSYPKLTGMDNSTIQDKVNGAIAAEAKDWKCDADTEPGKAQFSVSAKVTDLTPTVFSYTLSFDYYCGGPYPDAHSESRNFNLVTGEPLTLQDALPKQNSKTISDLFLKGPVTDADCRDSYNENTTYQFYVTPKGVVVFPDLPHVVQACTEELTISPEKDHP